LFKTLRGDRTQTCEAVPTVDSDEDLLLDVVRQRERQLRTTNTTINHNYHLPSSLLPHYMYLAKNRVLSCAAFRHGVYEIHGYYAPPLIGGGNRWCASDVCMSVCLTSVCRVHSGLSREQRGLGSQRHTWLGHHFGGQLAVGGGILWRPAAQLVNLASKKCDIQYKTSLREAATIRPRPLWPWLLTRTPQSRSKGQRSTSPGRFTHRRVGASGGCSGGRGNVLAVRNCCYVAVCSAARGASAPTGGGRGAGAYRGGSLFHLGMSRLGLVISSCT